MAVAKASLDHFPLRIFDSLLSNPHRDAVVEFRMRHSDTKIGLTPPCNIRLLSGLILLLALLALPACKPAQGAAQPASHTELPESDHPLNGAVAPDFSLALLNPGSATGASSVQLSQLQGKLVLIDFWATWCKPCRSSFPHYQALSERLGSDLHVIAISVDDESEGILPFIEETGVQFDVAWDQGGAVARQYQLAGMPTLFLVDAEGVIRNVHAGFRAGDESKIRASLEALLTQRAN